MTVLILSIWAFGIVLLIAFAVYRGKSAHTSAPISAMSAEEINELASKVRMTTSTHHAPEILRDTKKGNWYTMRDLSHGTLVAHKFVAHAGKPIKPGPKSTHVHFPKPGKPAR